MAPLPAGLPPAVAGTAQDGFEQLWQAYAYRRDKKSARQAYARLSPDAEIHAALLTAASAWRDAWAAQGKADAPRRHLHKWLEAECYDEVPPTAFKPRERQIRSATSMGTRTEATIKETTVRDEASKTELVVTMVGADGASIEDIIVLRSDNFDEQTAGQAGFTTLCHAAGRLSIQDSSELHGLSLMVSPDKEGLRYSEA